MSAQKDGWGWHGEEGGRQLGAKRLDNGAIEFSVIESDGTTAGTTIKASVTLAAFRVAQLDEWLAPTTPDPAAGDSPPDGSNRYILNRQTHVAHDSFNLGEDCNTDDIEDRFTKPALPDGYRLCELCAARRRERGVSPPPSPDMPAVTDAPIVAGLDLEDAPLDLPATIPPEQLQKPQAKR